MKGFGWIGCVESALPGPVIVEPVLQVAFVSSWWQWDECAVTIGMRPPTGSIGSSQRDASGRGELVRGPSIWLASGLPRTGVTDAPIDAELAL